VIVAVLFTTVAFIFGGGMPTPSVFLATSYERIRLEPHMGFPAPCL
jgi:hypothetical protein